MKKKNLFLNFFIFISLVIFYSLVDTKEIFLYVFSFSLYQLLVSLFSSIDITKEIINYNNLKYYYSKERLYKNVKIKIFYYSLILGIIVLLSSFLIGKFLNIDNLPLVFGVLSLTIWTKPFLNIIRSYTDAHNLKKEVNISFVIEKGTNIIYLLITAIILNKALILPSYLDNIIYLLSPLVNFLTTYLYLYKTVLSKKKKLNRLTKITREEAKINYREITKTIFNKNKLSTIIELIKVSYLYISIIMVYKTISLYLGSDIAEYMVVLTYFFIESLILLLKNTLTIFIKPLELRIKEFIETKNYNKASLNISNLYIIILSRILPLILTISILAKPLSILLFNDNFSYSILSFMIFEVIFIILFDITIDITKLITNKKEIIKILLIGLMFKLILTIPFIDSFYRMGYNLVYGDILCTIISLFITIILFTNIVRKKIKIDFSNIFKNILNILYNNIIISLILILLQLIIPFKELTRISSLLIIVFYLVIAIITYVIIGKLNKINLNN